MILTKEKQKIVPYFYGPSAFGKSSLMDLIRALGQGNVAPISLLLSPAQFENACTQGAQCLIFEDADYNNLTDRSATDIKRYTNGQELLTYRNSSTTVPLLKRTMVITANEKFSYKKASTMINDANWLRMLLTIPLPKPNNLVPEKQFLKNLLEDSGGLVGWVLAFPQEALDAMGSNAEAISNHLEKGLSDEGLDSICKTFFSETFALSPNEKVLAGHSSNPGESTATFKFQKYLREREFPIPKGRNDIKNAFARAIENLELTGKVTHRRGNQGWSYHGITVLKNGGTPIAVFQNPGIALLLKTPVLTYLGKDKKIHEFKVRGMASNEDLSQGNPL